MSDKILILGDIHFYSFKKDQEGRLNLKARLKEILI